MFDVKGYTYRILIGVFILLYLSSCHSSQPLLTVQKRQYRSGYYVEWVSNQPSVSSAVDSSHANPSTNNEDTTAPSPTISVPKSPPELSTSLDTTEKSTTKQRFIAQNTSNHSNASPKSPPPPTTFKTFSPSIPTIMRDTTQQSNKDQEKKCSPWAIGGCFTSVITPPVGAVLGIIALVHIYDNPNQYKGKALAWTVTISGILYTILAVLIALAVLGVVEYGLSFAVIPFLTIIYGFLTLVSAITYTIFFIKCVS